MILQNKLYRLGVVGDTVPQCKNTVTLLMYTLSEDLN